MVNELKLQLEKVFPVKAFHIFLLLKQKKSNNNVWKVYRHLINHEKKKSINPLTS